MNDEMLTLQATHRSSRVWSHQAFADKRVSVCRNDSRILEKFRDDRVEQSLRRSGFYGDVECLIGLRVDGEPVVFPEMVNPNTYLELFREVIGFEVLPGNTDREAERYIASVILQLLGGTLFPNSTGRFVAVEFLPLLRTPEITAQFSWGSAVLANLYRNLWLCFVVTALGLVTYHSSEARSARA
ncbi:hypothetical protein DM860_005918 [Cuscuta australis]|uniref:Aminotransferase-like plant mobile domain-containing protein n=1 Tax=Cuscuta australis TaxID=267555 RepID=A0A328DS85_9ASTE|nr:hypothetical protein DM860_005918 [Cuscuta australis]